MKKIMFAIIAVLVIGGLMINSSLDTDFSEPSDITTFAKEFGKWVIQLGKSTKNVAGYTVLQTWTPEVNSTP